MTWAGWLVSNRIVKIPTQRHTLHGLALLIILGYTLHTSLAEPQCPHFGLTCLLHLPPVSSYKTIHSIRVLKLETWTLSCPVGQAEPPKSEYSFHKLWNVVHESPTVNLDSLLLMLNLQNFDCSKYPPWPCLFFHGAEEATTSFLPQQMELPIAKRNKYKSIVFQHIIAMAPQKHSLKITQKIM
jgi:hypothetical protein